MEGLRRRSPWEKEAGCSLFTGNICPHSWGSQDLLGVWPSVLGTRQHTVVIEQNPQMIGGAPCGEKTVAWVGEGSWETAGHWQSSVTEWSLPPVVLQPLAPASSFGMNWMSLGHGSVSVYLSS